MPQHLLRVFCLTVLAAATSAAAVNVPTRRVAVSFVILDQLLNWPVFQWLTGQILPLEVVPDAPEPVSCPVSPLAELSDSEALDFESGNGLGSAVQLDGLTRETAQALSRFRSIVLSAGGRFILTSAYRPISYQEHLQAVWDKWMLELRHIPAGGPCDELRAEVQQEFINHGLLGRQRPATISDHSSGLAFDANVSLPRRGNKSRRRISTDSLARRAGLFRPVWRQDPVHFRLAPPRIKATRGKVASRSEVRRSRKQV